MLVIFVLLEYYWNCGDWIMLLKGNVFLVSMFRLMVWFMLSFGMFWFWEGFLLIFRIYWSMVWWYKLLLRCLEVSWLLLIVIGLLTWLFRICLLFLKLLLRLVFLVSKFICKCWVMCLRNWCFWLRCTMMVMWILFCRMLFKWLRLSTRFFFWFMCVWSLWWL